MTSVQTGEPEGHGRAKLADLLERRRHAIEARWLDRVRQELSVTHLTQTDLRDGIEQYLLEIARALRSPKALASAGGAVWRGVAREHALTRVRLGFDVDELTRELMLLRTSIVEIARSEGLLRDHEIINSLFDVIDPALSAAVRSYVEARDYAARREHAEHLGFLAHQVRSPLNAVSLALDQLRRLSEADEARRVVERAQRTLQRLGRMVGEVLQAEHLEARKVEARRVASDLGGILNDAVEAARGLAEKKGLDFSADYEAQMRLETDPSLLSMAIEHLLENSVKYTREGSVSLTVEEKPDAVTVHVYDTCGGLSNEELEIIFEPFRRGRTTESGTGLGLAIAKQAVEALGGTLHAESPGESGCHFWLRLPKNRTSPRT